MLEKPPQQKQRHSSTSGGRVQHQHQQHHSSSSSSSSSSPPPLPHGISSSSNAPGNGGNVDRVLFKNLVEMVPLVETLMDRRVNSSFTRRASMIYTPAPSNQKKSVEPKGRKTTQTISAKKQKDLGDNHLDKNITRDNQDNGGDDFSIFSSKLLAAEHAQKDIEEFNMLKEHAEELQRKLSEKDESLKSAEDSLKSAYGTLDELKRQVAEKESVVKSSQSQLNNVKIKLADKQAALEKLQWEAREANNKAEKLQGDLDSVDFEVTAFMRFFEELSKSDSTGSLDENIINFQLFDNLPNIDIDETAMEEARLAYVEAVAFAKENPSEESLALASEARLRLRAFV